MLLISSPDWRERLPPHTVTAGRSVNARLLSRARKQLVWICSTDCWPPLIWLPLLTAGMFTRKYCTICCLKKDKDLWFLPNFLLPNHFMGSLGQHPRLLLLPQWHVTHSASLTIFPSLFVSDRGEHILLFLVQTVARQSVEHCQYRPPRIREDRNRKAASAEGVSLSREVTWGWIDESLSRQVKFI